MLYPFMVYSSDFRGNTVWKKLEEKNLLPGRTWQSMKQRFKGFIMNQSEKRFLKAPFNIYHMNCIGTIFNK